MVISPSLGNEDVHSYKDSSQPIGSSTTRSWILTTQLGLWRLFIAMPSTSFHSDRSAVLGEQKLWMIFFFGSLIC